MEEIRKVGGRLVAGYFLKERTKKDTTQDYYVKFPGSVIDIIKRSTTFSSHYTTYFSIHRPSIVYGDPC